MPAVYARNIMLAVISSHLLLVSWAGELAARIPETVAPRAKLVEQYSDDGYFFEGPTWDPQTAKLYFTAFPTAGKDTQIWRLDAPGKIMVWARNTEGANGTRLARDGRLIAAQAYGHRIISYAIGAGGPVDTKVIYSNPKLHQPNDLCQTPSGDIFFTDPDWRQRRTSAVYHLDTTGRAKKVVSDMPTPNGVIASIDGRTLYVGDSHLKHWKAYEIGAGGSLGPGRVFFDPKSNHENGPDGMTIDQHGTLYLSGMGGVWVVSAEGKELGFLPIPEFCSNAAFGGPQGKTLFLTCSKKVYSIEMNVRGGQLPPAESAAR